jgi:Transglutaminase-like superfamily
MYYAHEPLTDKDQTAKRIKLLVEQFHGDLDRVFVPLKDGGVQKMSDMTLQKFYDFVRLIPYRRDPSRPPREVVARPYHIIKHRSLGMDCKKKAILLGSFLRCQGVPVRYIGSSQRKDHKVHHIFCQAFLNGLWKNVDATYRDYRLFQPKQVTFSEVL